MVFGCVRWGSVLCRDGGKYQPPKAGGLLSTSFIFGVIGAPLLGLTSQSGRGTVTGRLMLSVL